MEISNSFNVDRPVDETWRILTDLEFIAPCFPGAQLTEIEGEEYRGIVKIKVGPISAKYKGAARFIEQDAQNHRAELKAEGRDPRQGNANALVTASMQQAGESLTTVTVHTDLSLSGKIASFGRGAIEDISGKILGQFVDNLREKLASDQSGQATASGEVAEHEADQPSHGSLAEPQGVTPSQTVPGVRKIDAPEAEAVDLLSVGADTVLKRLAPIGIGLIVLLVLRRLLGGRG